jgi:RsiW-degrading membrane proteinase PrsW (M82 family)
MALFVALIFGLLPGFAWLAFYLGEDPHPEPKRLIAFTFVVGMAFGFFTVAIEMAFNGALANAGVQKFSILSLIGLAAIEEIMKFAAAHFVVSKSPDFDEPIDAMIYMIVAALGFATLENIGAISNALASIGPVIPSVFETLSLRFIGATLLHTLTSGIIGYNWALGIVKGKVKEYLLAGIIIATILHACFNYLILTYGAAAYSVVFLLVIGFFVLNDFEKLKEKPINIIT